MYDISVDRALRLVRVRIVGLLSPEVAAAYERDLKWQILNLGGSQKGYFLLIDLRESQVASKNDTGNLQKRMQWHVANGLCKSAYIVKSALHQIQIRRLSPDDHFNYFVSEEEAMSWLGI